MPPQTPAQLFDARFQAMQRSRRNPRCALFLKAEALLKERMEGLKQPPPDLCLSCFDLQCVNDFPEALHAKKEALRPGGLFLGLLAGGDSLKELRHSLLEAEIALKGGGSPRFAPRHELPALSRLLQESGLASPVADIERISLVYPDLFALMRDLRSLGLTNSLSARPRSFTPKGLFTKAAEIYASRFPSPSGSGIAATIDLIFLHGWKEERGFS